MARDPQSAYSQDPELYVPPTAAQSYSNKPKVEGQYNALTEKSRICGLRRATFWLVLLLIFVIIVAAVGGGVGGSIAVKNAKSENAPGPLTTVTAAGAGATASSSASGKPSSPSASATTTTNSSPSSTSTTYTPLAPTDVPLIDKSCPGGTITSMGKTYNCNDQRDYVHNDITGIIAYSLSACIDACTTFNLVKDEAAKSQSNADEVRCKAVALSAALKDSYNTNKGANCWLKENAPDGDTGLSFLKDTVVAVLLP